MLASNRVYIRYRNYRGEIAVRNIIPKTLHYGSNEWHSSPQWFMVAFDIDKNADRHFAMYDILAWGIEEPFGADLGNLNGET